MPDIKKSLRHLVLVFFGTLVFAPANTFGQEAYFIDGFHGGIWGHYPEGYTKYMLSLLEENPDWRMNLEIEPETWDRTKKIDNANYLKLQGFLADKSDGARVEYVNPSYGQGYLYNISGESVIRQFSYGMDALRKHFPNIEFTTYSSEEPCFTSALPQILKSFGFKYASLKNPNTCWGGYTRAHGGELVNWIGPDGTGIVTSPRYEFEILKPGSTWETIGNANSPDYIKAAFDFGLENPVGMTLQDAGWKWGPWLKGEQYKPSIYTTWRNYFENIADKDSMEDWRFNQEDVQVSLVWGAQVLQKLAQKVRVSENKIVMAEKIAAMDFMDKKIPYPTKMLDEAWKPLLLSQHHDCWIVPYNGEKGDTWADKVEVWTSTTDGKSDSILNRETAPSSPFIKVYNTLGHSRKDLVEIALPKGWKANETKVLDESGKPMELQAIGGNEGQKIVFTANVPSFGYSCYQLQKGKTNKKGKTSITKLKNGDYVMETDIYKLIIDSSNGGTIRSLLAKKLNNKEFVDQNSELKFNELRGYFFEEKAFRSNTENPVSVRIIEDGPLRSSISLDGQIAGHPYTQTITLVPGSRKIDLNLKIDWQGNVGIGEFKETDFKSTNLKKAFYNDRYKLLNLFPADLQNQKVYKNAPFDVMESGLEDTFFGSWDSIKNNVLLNWVDITDENEDYGLALFSDHTTSYAHGQDFPLGLNIQYSGIGLWGRDYSITSPTEINYALIPHGKNWQEAAIWRENEQIKEPLHAVFVDKPTVINSNSFLKIEKEGWILSSMVADGQDLLVRIFNAGGDANKGAIAFKSKPENAQMEELNKKAGDDLKIIEKDKAYGVSLSIPKLGFRNIRLKGYQ